MKRNRDLTGERIGRLLVVRMTKDGRSREQLWECACDCGAVTIKKRIALAGGSVKSCGCLSVEALAKGKLKHGHSYDGAPTSEYTTWAGMVARCNNRSHKAWLNYGGRGIAVCERWSTFSNFLADMGTKPSKDMTIERVNSNGNYEPSNCVWLPRAQQARNRRNNRRLTHAGMTLTVAEWSERTGIPQRRITNRLSSLGWTVSEALTKSAVSPGKRKPRSWRTLSESAEAEKPR